MCACVVDAGCIRGANHKYGLIRACIRGANHKYGLIRACVQALTAIRLPCRAVSCPQFAFESLQAACTCVADTILETMLPVSLPSERVQADEGNPQFFWFESMSNSQTKKMDAGAAGIPSRM